MAPLADEVNSVLKGKQNRSLVLASAFVPEPSTALCAQTAGKPPPDCERRLALEEEARGRGAPSPRPGEGPVQKKRGRSLGAMSGERSPFISPWAEGTALQPAAGRLPSLPSP